MTERIAFVPEQVANKKPERKTTAADVVITSSAFAGVFGGIASAFGDRQLGIVVGTGTYCFVSGVSLGALSAEQAKNLAIEGKTIKALLMTTMGSMDTAAGMGAAGIVSGFSVAGIKGALAGGISGAVLGGLSTFQDILETRRILKAGGKQLSYLNSSNEIASS
ncbi:hypothetical protein HY405_01345 [Candidatus Microgenomates bacterium]|nr:hypothetical protein [Candidatus Microgenomates bacterium]